MSTDSIISQLRAQRNTSTPVLGTSPSNSQIPGIFEALRRENEQTSSIPDQEIYEGTRISYKKDPKDTSVIHIHHSGKKVGELHLDNIEGTETHRAQTYSEDSQGKGVWGELSHPHADHKVAMKEVGIKGGSTPTAPRSNSPIAPALVMTSKGHGSKFTIAGKRDLMEKALSNYKTVAARMGGHSPAARSALAVYRSHASHIKKMTNRGIKESQLLFFHEELTFDEFSELAQQLLEQNAPNSLYDQMAFGDLTGVAKFLDESNKPEDLDDEEICLIRLRLQENNAPEEVLSSLNKQKLGPVVEFFNKLTPETRDFDEGAFFCSTCDESQVRESDHNFCSRCGNKTTFLGEAEVIEVGGEADFDDEDLEEIDEVKMIRAVRHGKVVRIKARRRKGAHVKRRMTVKQKMALAKARRYAHTGMANMSRRRSNKTRTNMGIHNSKENNTQGLPSLLEAHLKNTLGENGLIVEYDVSQNDKTYSCSTKFPLSVQEQNGELIISTEEDDSILESTTSTSGFNQSSLSSNDFIENGIFTYTNAKIQEALKSFSDGGVKSFDVTLTSDLNNGDVVSSWCINNIKLNK